MTFGAVLLGFFLAIFTIAIVIALLVFFVNKSIIHGAHGRGNISAFELQAERVFPDAPARSYVSLEIQTAPIEVFIRSYGKKKTGEHTYKLEVRLRNKQDRQLEEVLEFLNQFSQTMKRVDKGRGLIKLVSESSPDFSGFVEVIQALSEKFGDKHHSENMHFNWLIASSGKTKGKSK